MYRVFGISCYVLYHKVVISQLMDIQRNTKCVLVLCLFPSMPYPKRLPQKDQTNVLEEDRASSAFSLCEFLEWIRDSFLCMNMLCASVECAVDTKHIKWDPSKHWVCADTIPENAPLYMYITCCVTVCCVCVCDENSICFLCGMLKCFDQKLLEIVMSLSQTFPYTRHSFEPNSIGST